MGTKGKQIIKIDPQKIIDELNKALSDEWLAYYQYWAGSKVVKGMLKDVVIKELVEHANDELRHANMLADRIIQLNGTIVLSPKDWYKLTNCGYDAPEDPEVVPILKQNIKGEQCAIETYVKLLELVRDKDIITERIIEEILIDEVEHENDLENILEDMA
jgi:bacterioferritin